ncbi:MAG: hypothetical protein SFU53_06055 [Terrimicrobiaceae bacterium]|nr:hypothetical protein [Terrimicrobiaceae bacterium]
MFSSPRTGLSRRLALAAAIATLASSGAALAGGFGGPPPFTNGSPLITGVDGSYQATARAKNLTGVFRFQYSGGTQTSSQQQNNWVFFIGGQIQRGSVVANVGNGSVNGVLDSLASGTSTNSNGTISLPIIFLNANNSSSGEFSGRMDMNDPNAHFSGKGKLMPSPGSTNQVIAISQEDVSEGDVTLGGEIQITNAVYTNLAGSIPETVFNFQGVRTSTGVSAPTTSRTSAPTTSRTSAQ